MMRGGVWFIAGFCIAVTLIAELNGTAGLVIFICGMVTRYLFSLVIKWIFGTKWAVAHPLQALFWTHAHAFAHGLHLEKDPRDCRHCNVS